MSGIFDIAVSALQADQVKLEQISLNAANTTTPGYRRGVVSSVSFENALGNAELTPTASSQPVLVPPTLRRSTDLTTGGLTHTGRSLDVAVDGEGFFLLTNGAQTWLTRAGSMSVTPDGLLVGANGLRVIGMNGDIHLGQTTDLNIDGQGHVRVADKVVGQLRLVKPTTPSDLISSDGVLFEAHADQFTDVPANKIAVKAGFVEASNSNGLQDMLGIMEGVRHFESLIRVVQGYDEVLGKAIQKLGDI